MKKSILSVLVAGVMLASSVISLSASESQYPDYAEGENNSNPIIVTYATGLISRNDINFSVNGRILTINGTTFGSETLKEVVFKDVKVEKSSNGTNWTTEKSLGMLFLLLAIMVRELATLPLPQEPIILLLLAMLKQKIII